MIRSLHPRYLSALLACVALLRFDAALAYQTSDLTGNWRFHALASGPGQPWWERVRASIATNGVAAGSAVASDGDSSALAATFTVGATGLVTEQGLPQFRGALDVDRTVVVGTDTWSGFAAGTTELRVGVKTFSTYALPDLVGDWEIQSIASGPGAPWWQRGRILVAANGGFSGTFTESDGNVGPAAGTLGLASDGTVTFSGSASARGAIDGGRTVMVMTSTWSGFAAGTTDFSLALKMAPTYALADLAGIWEVSTLATGPGAPWWSRGTLFIAASGSYTGTMGESTGGSHPVSGTFGLSSEGVVTRSGSATARGALDAGKSVMAITDTWTSGSPGTSEMLIAVRVAAATTDAPNAVPFSFGLEPVRPHPARGGATVIHFTLPSAAPARLELIDVGGRCVAARDVGSMGPGRHAVELGRETALRSGVYWVRLRQGGASRVTRVVVLESGR